MIRGFGWWLCMHSHTDERRDLGRGDTGIGRGSVRFGDSGLSRPGVSWFVVLKTLIHPTPDRGSVFQNDRARKRCWLLEEFNLQINSDRLHTTQSSTHNHTQYTIL